MKILLKSETSTCSRRASDSVDVDLGKSGGVVVNDNLDRRNVQTSVASGNEKRLILDGGRGGGEQVRSTGASHLAATSVAIRIL